MTNHLAEKCFYKEKDCFKCQKKGHIAKMCKSEKRSTSVHAIAEGEESDSDSDEYTVYAVESIVEVESTA